MVHQLDRQKELYDERIHGKPLKRDDLVWLHSKVIPHGVGRKLHRPWTGPFRVVRDSLTQCIAFRTLPHLGIN